MTKVLSAAYVNAGYALLKQAQVNEIPYVPGGMSLDGMDCQGLAEYLLMACGVPKSECNLKGSNAHWRDCAWVGTPEECVEAFGCVPAGAWVFIVDYEGGGEVARGYTDGLGDANHMGVYLGGGVAIHASASRGCVAESAFREKTVPNGGWNAVGLSGFVDFGVDVGAGELSDGAVGGGSGLGEGLSAGTATGANGDSKQDRKANATATEAGAGAPVQGSGTEAANTQSMNPHSGDMRTTAVYALVVSLDGNPVKLRKSASQKEPVYWKVNPGARVRVEKVKGDWSLITAICSDGYQRRAYMMNAFLEREA